MYVIENSIYIKTKEKHEKNVFDYYAASGRKCVKKRKKKKICPYHWGKFRKKYNDLLISGELSPDVFLPNDHQLW